MGLCSFRGHHHPSVNPLPALNQLELVGGSLGSSALGQGADATPLLTPPAAPATSGRKESWSQSWAWSIWGSVRDFVYL